MSNWLDYDIDKTIYDFDYTKRAVAGMNRIMDSQAFADMDADMIFDYLSKEMEVVLFPGYLKRYIYQKLGMKEPFGEIPDEVYQDVLDTSFRENRAPYSFSPTTTKKTAMIKLWLTQPNVRRNVIFTLGFGLRMAPEEVSEFLTKVIKEEDFDFSDPDETLYWYCFRHSLPYSAYLRLKQEYAESPFREYSKKKWEVMNRSPKLFLLSEQNLKTYLSAMKAKGAAAYRREHAFSSFMELYERCRKVLCDMYNAEDFVTEQRKVREIGDIRPADLEKALCSGIPVNENNNLQPMSLSCLSSLFRGRRLSRQRISGILAGKYPVERYDLITLLFFIYAQTVEPDWPAERYMKYIDEVNHILERCGMLGIYPANPYEAFVLMCIVTDYPMDVYSQVWEKSYE